jgi:hypothetical protein
VICIIETLLSVFPEIQRSFYEPFPQITGKLRVGSSSTALHWLNVRTVGPDFFQHPLCIQPNQLPDSERRKFAEKWKADWRSFLHECSTLLVNGGALFFATLPIWGTTGGRRRRNITISETFAKSYIRKKLSEAELNAIFIPDYFATPTNVTFAGGRRS